MAAVRFSRAAVVVAFLAGVAGGCRSGDDDDAREPATTTVTEAADETTTTTAEATTTTLSPEDEVTAAYQAARTAASQAFNPPDPQFPLLLATTSGPQLARTQSNIGQLAAQGVGAITSFETHPTSSPVIVADRATFADCGIDRTQLVDLASGMPVGEAGQTMLHSDVVMERQGDTWLLVDATTRTEPCEPA